MGEVVVRRIRFAAYGVFSVRESSHTMRIESTGGVGRAHIATHAWSLLFLKIPGRVRSSTRYQVDLLSREKGLVERTFVELLDAVDGAHGGEVAEGDLAGADANDGTVSLKESLHRHALLQASDVGGEPEVRDGRIPRAGDGCQGREAELVYAGGAEEEERREDREEDEVGGVGEKGVEGREIRRD